MYADITLAVRMLLTLNLVKRVVILDVDAHQVEELIFSLTTSFVRSMVIIGVVLLVEHPASFASH